MFNEYQLEIILSKMTAFINVNNTRSIASIIEQVLSSALNMIISIVIVIIAGVADLGMYSFFFVIATLVNGLYQSLIHRQMLLISSPESEVNQDCYFRQALILNFLFFVTLVLVSIFLFGIAPEKYQVSWKWTVISVLYYIYVFNVFDLCKQFLYIRNRQVYSLKCTLSSALVSILFLIIIFYFAPKNIAVELVYLSIGTGSLVGLLVNTYCRSILVKQDSSNIKDLFKTLTLYWGQGKFGALSFIFTWIQGQSLNPLMMFIGGPIVAGYVSLGRLFVMPLSAVNQGLINSSMPSLRKTYSKRGAEALTKELVKYIKIILKLSLFYIGGLLFLHIAGVLEKIVPEYAEVSLYILFWSVYIVLAVFRYWCGQYFQIQIKLKLLLLVSVFAVTSFLVGVLITYSVLGNYRWLLFFMLVAEIISIISILLYKRKMSVN